MIQEKIAVIGTFDGVHLGHVHLLRQLLRQAAGRGLEPMAVTFSTHPLSVINPAAAPAMLTTAAERAEAIRAAGVANVAVLDFTPELRAMTAGEFMAMLGRDYRVKALLMGYDHRFGSDHPGSLERYREAAAPLGLEVLAADEYRRSDGTAISSSAIRRALAVDGDAAGAALSLGRPYRLSGAVGHGRQIGRTIGFPTANVEGIAAGKVIPAAGVYAATATVDGAAHTAVVNIGSRPTVTAADGSAASRTIEAHLLGFDGDIYSRGITLDFTRRLRDERRFDSLEALSLQIAADIANAAGGQ